MTVCLRVCGIALCAALLAACGDDASPGEAEPKRTLDPQAEAVRFFPARTGALALVRADMPRRTDGLLRSAAEVPGLAALLSSLQRRLERAGVDPGAVMRLARPEEEGVPAPELAAGIVSGTGGPQPLFVLPTERADELSRLFADAAAGGGLDRAGEFDDADLYRGPDCAFALRDGVLIASRDLAALRRAITTRDGDAAEQMDDGEVRSAVDDVPGAAPLHVFVRLGERRAALAVAPADGGADVRVVAEVPEPEEGEVQGPRRTTVDAGLLSAFLRRAIGPPPPELAAALVSLAPLEGASFTDGGRLLANFAVGASAGG